MKEIFDWLREAISKESWLCAPRTKGHYSDDAVFVEDAMKLIDEAEAKWEEDCCEWEYNEFEEQWETSCGVLLNPNSNDREVTHYCCCCGKRIKIVGVE